MEYLILKLCRVGAKLLVMTRSRKLPWPSGAEAGWRTRTIVAGDR